MDSRAVLGLHFSFRTEAGFRVRGFDSTSMARQSRTKTRQEHHNRKPKACW